MDKTMEAFIGTTALPAKSTFHGIHSISTQHRHGFMTTPCVVARRRVIATIQMKGGRAGGRFSDMSSRGMPQGGPPPLPQDGTPVFVIFARTQHAKVWYPVGMVGGDSKAKTLVAGMNSALGKKLYGGALDRGIAQVVFGPDSKKFLENGMKQYPQLKKYRNELDFGYKVVSSEIKDWPTTIITREQAMPFMEWAKMKLGLGGKKKQDN